MFCAHLVLIRKESGAMVMLGLPFSVQDGLDGLFFKSRES